MEVGLEGKSSARLVQGLENPVVEVDVYVSFTLFEATIANGTGILHC